MVSEYQIYCDYKKALNKATEIEEISRKIRMMAEYEVRNENYILNNCWNGPGKDAFGKKLVYTADELQVICSNLNKIADTIRIIAQKNYESELKALKIAKDRSYR